MGQFTKCFQHSKLSHILSGFLLFKLMRIGVCCQNVHKRIHTQQGKCCQYSESKISWSVIKNFDPVYPGRNWKRRNKQVPRYYLQKEFNPCKERMDQDCGQDQNNDGLEGRSDGG